MAGTLPNAAELNLATEIVNNLMVNWYARLLKASVTLNTATTLASLSAQEATFTGYAAAALTTWSAPSIDGTNAAITTSTQAIFTGTAGGGTGNLYGYYITNSAQTEFYGAELFTGGPLSEPQNVALEVDITYSVITRF